MRLPRTYAVLWLPVVALIVLRLGFDFNGLYGQDPHEYLRFSEALRLWLLEGQHPGGFFWPVTYPLLTAIISLPLGDVALAGQVVSALAFGGTLWMLRKLLVALHPDHSASVERFVVCCALASPYLLRASTIVMSDMLSVFFISAALYNFLAHREAGTLKHYLLFVALSVLAVSTRYQAVVVLFVPQLVAGWQLLKTRKIWHLAPAMAIAAVLAIPHFALQQNDSLDFVNHYGLQSWRLKHFFQSEFVTPDGLLSFRFPNVLFTLSSIAWPGILVLGLPLLLLLKRSDFSEPVRTVALIALLFNALFLAGVPFQNTRHLLLAFPLMMLLLAPGWLRIGLFVESRTKQPLALPVFVLALQLVLCTMAFRPTISDQQEQQAIATAVKELPASAPVYTFAIEMALESYDVPNPVENIYHNRYESLESGSLLLVNNSRFATIFENRNPMLNWESANTQHQLELLERWPSGWELYLVP